MKRCLISNMDYAEEKYGYCSEQWAAASNDQKYCMLEDGHTGDHDFVPSNEIVISEA